MDYQKHRGERWEKGGERNAEEEVSEPWGYFWWFFKVFFYKQQKFKGDWEDISRISQALIKTSNKTHCNTDSAHYSHPHSFPSFSFPVSTTALQGPAPNLHICQTIARMAPWSKPQFVWKFHFFLRPRFGVSLLWGQNTKEDVFREESTSKVRDVQFLSANLEWKLPYVLWTLCSWQPSPYCKEVWRAELKSGQWPSIRLPCKGGLTILFLSTLLLDIFQSYGKHSTRKGYWPQMLYISWLLLPLFLAKHLEGRAEQSQDGFLARDAAHILRGKEEPFVLFHAANLIPLQIHYGAMGWASPFSVPLRVFATALKGAWENQILYSENTT